MTKSEEQIRTGDSLKFPEEAIVDCCFLIIYNTSAFGDKALWDKENLRTQTQITGTYIYAGKRGRHYTNTWVQSGDENLWGYEAQTEDQRSEHECGFPNTWDGVRNGCKTWRQIFTKKQC